MCNSTRVCIPIAPQTLLLKVLDSAKNPTWSYEVRFSSPCVLMLREEMDWLRENLNARLVVWNQIDTLNEFTPNMPRDINCLLSTYILEVREFNRDEVEYIMKINRLD